MIYFIEAILALSFFYDFIFFFLWQLVVRVRVYYPVPPGTPGSAAFWPLSHAEMLFKCNLFNRQQYSKWKMLTKVLLKLVGF